MPTPYDTPKVRTWEFENRAQRRQRQMAQFQQLAEDVRPHVLAGDYATAQALIAARVPGVKTPPAPPPPATPPPRVSTPKKRGGGGLLGRVKDLGGELVDAGQAVGGAALTALDAPRKYAGQPLFSVLSGTTGNEVKTDPRTGETYRDAPSFADVGRGLTEAFTRDPRKTYREARQASEERQRDPGLNGFSRTLLQGAADPLNFVAPGAVSAGMRVLPESARAARLARVGAALVENPARATAGAIVGSAAGAGTADAAGFGSVGQTVGALAGGIAGGGLAGRGTMASAPVKSAAEAASPGMAPDVAAVSGGSLGLPPLLQARDEILNLPGLQPTPLGRGDRIGNAIKRTVGAGIEEDPIATPAMRERQRLRPIVDSQAARLGQVATDIVRRAGFTFDESGRILDFGDAKPTVQDVAARLPEFAYRMTGKQLDAMEELRREVAPYAAKLAEVGVELHQRGDVIDGGFYLPRGRADVEGADAPVRTGGRGRPGGRKGFEKTATFASMEEGVNAGYEYSSFGDAMQAYARDAGNRAVDQHVANYFKTLTDEDGNLIAETAADRVPVALRAQWQDTAGRVASVRKRLNTALRRARLATGEADELDRALDDIAPRVPEGAGKLAGIGKALDRESARAQGLRDRARARVADTYETRRAVTPGGPVRMELPITPETAANRAAAARTAGQVGDAIDRVVSRLEQYVPEDVDRIATLESAIRRSGRRLDSLLQRGGKHADEARQLQAELDAAESALEALRPEWRTAQERARQTPRGQGAINFAQLSGYSFPEAIANAANKYIDAEGPIRGRGAATVATVTALNHLLRGLRASADVSFMGVQGLLGAARDPMGYGKALGVAWRAIADPDALGRYLTEYDAQALKAGKLTSKEWAKANLHIGGADSEFAVGRGLTGRIGALGTADTPKIGLNPFRGSNRMFGYFGDVLRLEMADTSATLWSRLGADLKDPAVRQQIADAANMGTGWSRNTFGGDVGQLGMFAPRFFQSQLDMLAKAAADGTIAGHEARIMLTSLIGSAVALTVLANELSPDGLQPADYLAPFKGKGGLNPNFLRFRAGGQDISLLGPWDSLARGLVATAQGDQTYIVRSKASPAVGLAWDLLSGETFAGEEAGLDKPGYLVRQVLPFSASGIGTEAPAGTALGVTGLKASDLSPTEQLDQVAATFVDPETGRANGKRFYDSSPATKKAIKEAHPDLWERAVEKGSRQRQQYEEAKAISRQQQEGDDELLLAGKLSREQWASRRTNRQQQLIGQQQAIYRDAKGKVATGDAVLDAYHARIDASSAAHNGQPLWDEVYAWVDALPETARAHIETNSGLDRTPLAKLQKKVSSEYYAIPQFRGFTADEGSAINGLLDEVYALAGRGADETRRLRVLRQIVAEGGIEDRVASGARRRILGLLVESRERELFRKKHPEIALLTRQGPLTPADVAGIRTALEG